MKGQRLLQEFFLVIIIMVIHVSHISAQPNPFDHEGMIPSDAIPGYLSGQALQLQRQHRLDVVTSGSPPQIVSVVAQEDTVVLPDSGWSRLLDIGASVTDPDGVSDVDSVWFFSRNSTYPNRKFFLDSTGNGEWSLTILVSWNNNPGIYPFVFFAEDREGNLSDSVVHNIFLVRSQTAVDSRSWSAAHSFELQQNYPNPFNPSTVITYQMPTNNFVRLKVYDVLGREMKTLVNERQNAGSHSVTFDATGLPSGVYFYRIQAGTFGETKKLVLLK